jgi:hypothetical protein
LYASYLDQEVAALGGDLLLNFNDLPLTNGGLFPIEIIKGNIIRAMLIEQALGMRIVVIMVSWMILVPSQAAEIVTGSPDQEEDSTENGCEDEGQYHKSGHKKEKDHAQRKGKEKFEWSHGSFD